MNIKYEDALKKGKLFDILSYVGLFNHLVFSISIALLLLIYPNLMGYEGSRLNWWYFYSTLIGSIMIGGTIYAVLLKYTMKNHPNIFNKIASEPYLKFIEKNYHDV